MNKPYFLLSILLMSSLMGFAQGEFSGNQPPQRESAEVRAIRITQMLRDTLKLDTDQFNRVYKVYYNEFSAAEQQMMSQGMGGGMPPQGMGGGMPPQGMGGGMPPQGMGGGMPPQGMDGGMPPQGMNFGDMSTPPSPPKEMTEEQMQKQIAKRQKKMKKILTEQQYELWLTMGKNSATSAQIQREGVNRSEKNQ